jgi:transposase InsO family protein
MTKAVPAGNSVEVADFLIEEVAYQHGCVEEILSDRGQVFRSNLVKDLLRGLGVRSTFTSSYHPQCNGLVEHFNGVMAQMLSNFVSSTHKDWDIYVKACTFPYNTSVQETTRFAPFYLVYGYQAVLPIDQGLGGVVSCHRMQSRGWTSCVRLES